MKKEKRRFPLEETFMKGDKRVNKSKPSDMLYGYLQMISTTNNKDGSKDENIIRFVYKKNYSNKKVEDHFGYRDDGKPWFPQRNVQRAMRALIQFGYVRESLIENLEGRGHSKIYELPYNVDEMFQYINLDTLQFMLRTCNPNVLKLYIYFKYKHFCHGTEFIFTEKILLKECFGLTSFKNKVARDELRDRLKMLRLLGLIDYCEFVLQNSKGLPIPVKRLTFLSDTIKEIDKNKKIKK